MRQPSILLRQSISAPVTCTAMAPKMKDYFNADTAQKLGAQLGIDGEEYAAWVAPRVEDLEILDRVTVFAQGLRE